MLTGDGGDELFGGYRRYAADQAAPWYQRLPGRLTRSLIPAVVGRLPRLGRIKRTLTTLPIADPPRRYASWLTVLTPDMRAELLRPSCARPSAATTPPAPTPRLYPALNGATAGDHLNRLLYVT